MNINHYTYGVMWSPEDNEHVGLCAEFPSLSWLDGTPESALQGIRQTVAEVISDMDVNHESVHIPRKYRNEQLTSRMSCTYEAIIF